MNLLRGKKRYQDHCKQTLIDNLLSLDCLKPSNVSHGLYKEITWSVDVQGEASLSYQIFNLFS